MDTELPPRFILFAGLSGTGKSTLALELSLRLPRAAVISKDLISGLLLLEGDAPDDAAWRAFEVAFGLAQDFLAQRITPILDMSSMLPFMYERAAAISAVTGVPLHVIHCSLDAELRHMRLRRRPVSLAQARAGAYHDQTATFAYLPAERLIVDTSRPLGMCVQDILDYLGAGVLAL